MICVNAVTCFSRVFDEDFQFSVVEPYCKRPDRVCLEISIFKRRVCHVIERVRRAWVVAEIIGKVGFFENVIIILVG